ncbi:MAG: hypothetical protein JSV22_06350 [Bacteroidales bacterium]|nr:MAG: hypothetical protein JSV22_06350 [Bacteroidales bacterium]
MKTFVKILVILFISQTVSSQSLSLNLQNSVGFTIVDVESAWETELHDWGQFSYSLVAQGILNKDNGLSIGAETGLQRLYYWEERYYAYVPDPVPRYRWGTIWTLHIGAILEKKFENNFYLQSGVNARIFLDGSGVTPGILAAAGYELYISDSFRIPLGLRIDIVFGNATPIPVTLGAGLKYNLEL